MSEVTKIDTLGSQGSEENQKHIQKLPQIGIADSFVLTEY
jgi:hypothetical protein